MHAMANNMKLNRPTNDLIGMKDQIVNKLSRMKILLSQLPALMKKMYIQESFTVTIQNLE